MELGVIIAKDSNQMRSDPHWLAGVAEKSWFGGIKLGGRQPLKIETFRCRKCNLLESYAPD